MPLVTFKDLCIDANNVPVMQAFWSSALGLDGEFFDDDGSAVLRGTRRTQTVWLNLVPEARQAKGRVHLDLIARSLEPFAGCRQLSGEGEFSWTVFADPEGNEFCVFIKSEGPTGLKDVVVDSVDPANIGAWWTHVWGGTIGDGEDYTYIDDIPGAPVESFDFVPVPEPKTVKNRLHWDVTLEPGITVADLQAVGATVLAEPTQDDKWTVMADPEGNEFCVFEQH